MFIYRFFKEWRKNPRWSFSCCLALLLPLNDLHQEVLGMTGKNVLKQQLKSGKVDMPSLSGALKESGAVSIELNIFPEHPEETSGSPSEETEAGRKKKRNADKDTGSTGDEPKKQATTTKKEVKQNLQTGNVLNISSQSGALKKSGAVRIVRASILERPKKTRGSISEEKNRLLQDTIQQEEREMRTKNPLKQQLKTGKVSTSSESGALKKSGAVRIVRASIHERPKKTRGSISEEKNRLLQDTLQQEVREMRTNKSSKEQLRTGNVNTPSESGAVKKSGAVRIVRANIHERPKKARGSISEEENRLLQDTLQQEVREMRNKKPSKEQLRNGNVNTPSESGTLKKSGAVRIVRASTHDRPKQTRRSISEEKNRLLQDTLQQEVREMRTKKPSKEQLITGNVNTPSESGALKKSGPVDFVLVTIHEHPKEACLSPCEERGTGEMKQGDDNKVATSTPEEELEETRL